MLGHYADFGLSRKADFHSLLLRVSKFIEKVEKQCYPKKNRL